MSTGLTMKAVQCTNYGMANNVLNVKTDVPRPQIGNNQVLIRAMAASINPIDFKLLHGDYSMMIKRHFPHIPGFDVSGVIEQVGKDVKRFKIGDAVFSDVGMNGGAFAEFVPADENNVSIKPTSLNFAEAACLPMVALTAYQALHIHAKVEKGQKILIIGAAGGVGHIACQMAKIAGMNVTAVTGGDSIEFVKKLGCVDKIIDYKQENWGSTLKDQHYNCVLDTVGGYESWVQADQNVLAKGGIFVTTVGDEPDNKATISTVASGAASVMARKFWSNFGEHHRYEVMLKYTGKPEELDAIRAMCDTGKLKPQMRETFTMTRESVLSMYSTCESRTNIGKLCLMIGAKEGTTGQGGALKGQTGTMDKGSDWKM